MNKSSRKLSFFRLLPFVTAAVALPVFAQTPVPPSSQTTILQTSQIKPRPIPTRMVGVSEDKTLNWTLRDAIVAALEKNVDIQLERENVRLAEFDLLAARGVYDPTFTSTLSYNPNRFPNATPSAGTTTPSGVIIPAVGKVFKTSTLNYNFGMSRQIERTGATIDVNFNNQRINSNRSNLDPQYQPSFGANFVQPLLRNRKIDANRRQIKIQSKQLDVSDAVFRQRAIDIISRVQQAYWDLAFALRDEQIQREAVSLAETQLANNQRQVEVGTLAPIDVVSAATTVESRRINVFQAMNTVAQAENALKQLVVDSPDSEVWISRIVPVESFEIQPIPISLDEAIKLARDNRPELRQLALQKEINDINIDFFKNQMKPQVNAFVNYSPFGIAGTPTRATINTVDKDFNGGYGRSLVNMLTNRYSTLSFGFNISIPWKNKIAAANFGRAKEQTKQIDLQVRKQTQDIETAIRNDVQSIEFIKFRIEAARAAEEYASQQLLGEEKRFQAGLSTTFLVLQRQNELTIAKGNLLRALTDYNKLVAVLQRDIGTTLATNNIEVKSEAAPSGAKQ